MSTLMERSFVLCIPKTHALGSPYAFCVLNESETIKIYFMKFLRSGTQKRLSSSSFTVLSNSLLAIALNDYHRPHWALKSVDLLQSEIMNPGHDRVQLCAVVSKPHWGWSFHIALK